VFLVVDDFDHDGSLDIVVVNSCGDGDCSGPGNIAFLKGDGKGSLALVGSYGAGHRPNRAAVGDYDEDGSLDVAVTDYNRGVDILLGNGDGSFGRAQSFDVGAFPTSVVTGDFNHDGHLDLAASNAESMVSILFGDGQGTFGAAVPYTIKGPLRMLTAADLNGDGNLDLAAAVGSGSDGRAVVLYGKADGTFPLTSKFHTDLDAMFVAVGDFNHDHAPDLVSVNFDADDVSILLNSGGTFVTATSSENPAPAGQPVTFTATVAPSLISTIPTGAVQFADGTTILATVPLDQNGVASYTTSGLSTGTHTIRTKYSGDSNFNPNMGQPLTQIIE